MRNNWRVPCFRHLFFFLMIGIIQLLLRRGETVNMMDLQQEHPDLYDNLARMQARIHSKQSEPKAETFTFILSTSTHKPQNN
jgi:hypothetical protein